MSRGDSRIKLTALLLLNIVSCSALAEEVGILGVFQALYANTRGSFNDETPRPPCYPLIQSYCAKDKLMTTRISFYSDSAQPAGSELSISIPAAPRQFTLVHEDGQTTRSASIVLQAVGGKVSYPLLRGESIEKSISSYWEGGDFSKSIAPCTHRDKPVYQNNALAFYWRIQQGSGECKKNSARAIEGLRVEDVFFVASVTTPDPLKMKYGDYRGRVRYSVGTTGSDIAFSFGNGGGRVNDTELVLNYLLRVEPFFRVEVPAGGNRVELAPLEGWQRWLHHRRAPTRLLRNQTFNLWSNGNFTMSLDCPLRLGNNCALQSDGQPGHLVPLNVAVTLPGNFADQSGKRVINRALSVDVTPSDTFKPDIYLERAPGSLLFEVQKDAVDEMVRSAGSQYRGTVIVLWESAL